ncbi:MAG: methionine synthase [Mycobacterium sp.]|nr:methionine synthase [Mycobacterium sp.]
MTSPAKTDLLAALSQRVLIADGAMGTMLQDAGDRLGLSLDDFEGHDGCNEVLNVTRPDVVREVHDAYFAVGVDAVETNTFGTNYGNLGEYGIVERTGELAQAGARIAREAADAWSTPEQQRYVIGSVGPGTKLPTLGHAPYALLRDVYQQQVEGMLDGGVDAVLVETSQDLLQTKSALVGARRAMRVAGRDVALIAHITVETTGTMLLGSETSAALTALEPLGIDLIGLNCATGPAEMSEHLRTLSQLARVGLSVMPNAGLPELTAQGARYPLQPEELAEALERFVRDYGVGLVGGCCGTTPEHLRRVVERVRGMAPAARDPRPEPGVASLYSAVPFRQDASALMIGERTNANGSKAFRDALLAGDGERMVEMARQGTREGAHLLDVCVDYVGRDGAVDMADVIARYATASTLPIVLDSTEPAVIQAGLERLGGRAVINSVNFEDGEGPESRFARVMPLVQEHGAAVIALTIDETGQARTVEHKLAVAERLIDTLVGQWGLQESDILVDCLTFTLATGQEESRKDGIATIEAIRQLSERHPAVQTVLGLSNVSFGLSPVSRQVLNSVFLAECRDAGLTAAIVHASKIIPVARIPEEQVQVALDLIYDRRRPATADAPAYDPLTRFLELFEGVSATDGPSRAEQLAALPLEERLQRRIIDGERIGLDGDLAEALQTRTALDIVNTTLLAGMKVVGELFGSGQMQLPFVLQSAEVMKAAVAYLEPHMDKADSAGKGTMVLATVKGDVHDIGKNLVDIILSNNGYTVVNLGIKQPIAAIAEAAQEHKADAIGMSGLLVKSTVVMRENLGELNARGVTTPVVLGGAALTRSFVEDDLTEVYGGEVAYARDAFEGLRLMDTLMAGTAAGAPSWLGDRSDADRQKAEERRNRRRRAQAARDRAEADAQPPARSDVATDVDVPTPPFWGSRVVKGIPLGDYAGLLDERATFLGQWGLRGTRGGEGPSYEELVETEGRPRLRAWLDRFTAEQVLQAAVVYGYFPCVSKGDDLIVLAEPRPDAPEVARFTFPRQRRDRHLCIADFFRPAESGEVDVVAFHVVTMGQRISDFANVLFAGDSYRDYLEVHGLGVQLTEALAEHWHSRVRTELGIATADSSDLDQILGHQGYRGSRYSFGYGACPNLEDRATIMRLLDAQRIGVELSEEFQLAPEQSTDAMIVHHPEAKYFNAR